jgi:CBS domain-containing protein
MPPPYVVGPHATLRELVELWQGDTGENYTPVVHEGVLIGLIGRSQAYDVPQGYWDARTVGRTMQPISAIATIAPDTPLADVLPRVDLDPFHPVPLLVAADGQLAGLIDAREIEPLLDVQEVFGMPTGPAAPVAAVSPTADPPARPVSRTIV